MLLVCRRQILLFLLSSIAIGLPKHLDAKEALTTWNLISKLRFRGGLRIFWNIYGRDNDKNQQQAIDRGMEVATTIGTYSDYRGNQKENIYNFLDRSNRQNPWNKPTFFDKTVKQNLENIDSKSSILVHDIEFDFEKDPQKAWQNEKIRRDAKSSNFKDFADRYYQEWAKWYTKPCQLAKKVHPHKPIGIYGPQLFNRDFWGFTETVEKLEQAHRNDLKLWQHIDPYVDFYAISTYIFYDLPDSVYYVAANIEENYRRSLKFGKKPIYAYVWLKYHPSNQKLSEQEIAPYLAEASAVLPTFAGAKGVVLWGWEPEKDGPYYQRLPMFTNSLNRLADLSAKIAKAKLIIDRPAHELWREKLPLVRKLKVSNSEWVVMAAYPWQDARDRKIVRTTCGSKIIDLEIEGKHTEIYYLKSGVLRKIPLAG
jgi:hypothetical protein